MALANAARRRIGRKRAEVRTTDDRRTRRIRGAERFVSRILAATV